MAKWQAECWLGSSVGMQTLEVNANTASGADQSLRRIYGAERVINLKQIESDSEIFSKKFYGNNNNLGASSTIFGLIVILALIITFLPWVTMFLGGAFGAWTSGKILGSNLNDAIDEEKGKVISLILLTSIIFGGVGYVKGTEWHEEFNSPSVPENVTDGSEETKKVDVWSDR
jgi:hypothetical protein